QAEKRHPSRGMAVMNGPPPPVSPGTDGLDTTEEWVVTTSDGIITKIEAIDRATQQRTDVSAHAGLLRRKKKNRWSRPAPQLFEQLLLGHILRSLRFRPSNRSAQSSCPHLAKPSQGWARARAMKAW